MFKKAQSQVKQTVKSLRDTGLHANKILGQHFLVDDTTLNTIVTAANISPADFIIEIGPGLGTLTSEIAKLAGTIVAIELDSQLYARLKQKFRSFSKVSLINEDILKINLSKLLGNRRQYKVVANIPYYITSPILQYFMQAAFRPSLMVIMVQKEVGEAIVASQGKMNMLSISMQLYSKPEIVTHVPAKYFYPVPKVDSTIIRFNMLSEPAIKVVDVNHFLKFVKCGFHSPRKQLRNSLSQGLDKISADIDQLINKANIEPRRRPETLSIIEWQWLYEIALESELF